MILSRTITTCIRFPHITNSNNTPKNSNEIQEYTPEPANWFHLPKSVMVGDIAARHMNLKDTSSLSRACKNMYNDLFDNQEFWKFKLQKEYGIKIKTVSDSKIADNIDWRETFKTTMPEIINTRYKWHDLQSLINKTNYNFELVIELLDSLYKQCDCAGLIAAGIFVLDKDDIQWFTPEEGTSQTPSLNPKCIQKIKDLATPENLCLSYFMLCEGKDKEEAQTAFSGLNNQHDPTLMRECIAKGLTLSQAMGFIDKILLNDSFPQGVSTDLIIKLLVKYCQFSYPKGFLEVEDILNVEFFDDNCAKAMVILVKNGSTPKEALEEVTQLSLALVKFLVKYFAKGLSVAEVKILCTTFSNEDELEVVGDTLLKYGKVKEYGEGALTAENFFDKNGFDLKAKDAFKGLLAIDNFSPKEAMRILQVFLSGQPEDIVIEFDIDEIYALYIDFPYILNFDQNNYGAIKNLVQKEGITLATAIKEVNNLSPLQVYALARGLTLSDFKELSKGLSITESNPSDKDIILCYKIDTLGNYSDVKKYGMEGALTAKDFSDTNHFDSFSYNAIYKLVEAGYQPKESLTIIKGLDDNTIYNIGANLNTDQMHELIDDRKKSNLNKRKKE